MPRSQQARRVRVGEPEREPAILPAVRVLHVTGNDSSVPPLLAPLIGELRQQGFRVAAACPDGSFARTLAGSGHVVHTLPAPGGTRPWDVFRFLWILRRLLSRERFDIVHVHTPLAGALGGTLGRFAARISGVPVVICTAYRLRVHRSTRLSLWTERLVGRITDLFMTQSAEDAQLAINERIRPPQHVVWISSGVDLERFRPAGFSRPDRAALGIETDEKVVGFVGDLARDSGVVELVRAMTAAGRRLQRLVLLIAGDADENGTRGSIEATEAREIRRYLAASGLSFRTVFADGSAGRESVMRAIDLLAVPSHRDGMPRGVIEAMATARPVVAPDAPGCREEVVNGETGYLIPAGDAGALEQAIVLILSDPRLAGEMGARARLRAEVHFDEREVIGRQVAAYRRIVRERLPGLTSPLMLGSQQCRRH